MAAARAGVTINWTRSKKKFSAAGTGIEQFEIVGKWRATRIYRQIASLQGNDGLIIEPELAPKANGATHYVVLDASQVKLVSAPEMLQESLDDDPTPIDGGRATGYRNNRTGTHLEGTNWVMISGPVDLARQGYLDSHRERPDQRIQVPAKLGHRPYPCAQQSHYMG